MADLYQLTFDIEATARAVGVSPVTIRSWMAKGHTLRGAGERPDLPPSGGGGARRSWAFGFCSVMEMAVGQAILNVGPRSLETAFSAAWHFAYIGETFDGLRRSPGLPFLEEGVSTLLLSSDGYAEVVAWRPGMDPLSGRLGPLRDAEGLVLIDCGKVFARVADALGLDRGLITRAAPGAEEGEA